MVDSINLINLHIFSPPCQEKVIDQKILAVVKTKTINISEKFSCDQTSSHWNMEYITTSSGKE
uniref:Uncharacterized protein n=1 Tax=Romanomermis culicivorax TaxID=13658 RepID=A0A915IKQ7_ROMCU